MNKTFVSILQAGLLVGLLGVPLAAQASEAAASQSTVKKTPPPVAPRPAHLPRKNAGQEAAQAAPVVSQGPVKKTPPPVMPRQRIDATYAVKKTVQALIDADPELSIADALAYSPLLGEINQDWVAKEAFGAFIEVADPKHAGWKIKVFASNTGLNRVARLLFDILHHELRTANAPSSPFLGLSSDVVGLMVLSVMEEGTAGLANTLQDQTPPQVGALKTKKAAVAQSAGMAVGVESDAVTSELSLVQRWWNAYSSRKEKGKDKEPDFKKKVHAFGKVLADFAAETVMPQPDGSLSFEVEEEVDQEKSVQDEQLLKLLMTFVYLKDEKDGRYDKAYSIDGYFKALKVPFTRTYYTTQERILIDKILRGEIDETIEKTPKGLEDLCFYLTAFASGNVGFLHTPYATFVSKEDPEYEARFEGSSYSYCVEAAMRSFVNVILYNPKTKKLDMSILPEAVQNSMNPAVAAFLKANDDPSIPDYYKNSYKKWLLLMSGIPGVLYVNDAAQGGFEISGNEGGPENFMKVLNYIFGTRADSFEQFGAAFSTAVRTVQLTTTEDGADIVISEAGQQTSLKAALDSKKGGGGASFELKGNSLYELMDDGAEDEFVSIMRKMVEYSGQDLWALVFKPSLLNVASDDADETALTYAIENNFMDVAEIALSHGSNPNMFDDDEDADDSPLAEAIDHEVTDPALAREYIDLLLRYHADVTDGILKYAAQRASIGLLTFLIAEHDKNHPVLNPTDLLPYSGSITTAEFLLEQGADINGTVMCGYPIAERSVLAASLQATVDLMDEDSLLIVKFLVEKGALLKDIDLNDDKFLLNLLGLDREVIAFVMLQDFFPLVSFIMKSNDLMQLAVKESKCEAIRFLLERGFVKSDAQLFLPLAIKEKDFSLMHYLIGKNVHISSDDLFDIAQYRFAYDKEDALRTALLQEILKRPDMKLNQRNAAGKTVFQVVLDTNPWVDVVKILLDSGKPGDDDKRALQSYLDHYRLHQPSTSDASDNDQDSSGSSSSDEE